MRVELLGDVYKPLLYSLTYVRGTYILPQFRVTVKNAVGGTYVRKTEKRG